MGRGYKIVKSVTNQSRSARTKFEERNSANPKFLILRRRLPRRLRSSHHRKSEEHGERRFRLSRLGSDRRKGRRNKENSEGIANNKPSREKFLHRTSAARRPVAGSSRVRIPPSALLLPGRESS